MERLSDGDARALGLAPAELAYRTVGELPGAGDKAAREAGSISAVDLGEAAHTHARPSPDEPRKRDPTAMRGVTLRPACGVLGMTLA